MHVRAENDSLLHLEVNPGYSGLVARVDEGLIDKLNRQFSANGAKLATGMFEPYTGHDTGCSTFGNHVVIGFRTTDAYAPSAELLHAILRAVNYCYGVRSIQYYHPCGDEIIYELDGTKWHFYSAASNLQYDSALDLVGMNRE